MTRNGSWKDLPTFWTFLPCQRRDRRNSAKVFGRYAKLPFEVTRQVALIGEPDSARNLGQRSLTRTGVE